MKTRGIRVNVSPGQKPQTPLAKRRVDLTLQTAATLGLTEGKKERRLSGRAHDRLVQAAQQTSGLEGSELLEYALARVALEDDYIGKLLALQGAIGQEVDLEF